MSWAPAVPGDPGVAIVLAGGELPAPHLLPELLTTVGPVIAADGGLRHAASLGLAPDLLVGDLDSVAEGVLAAYPGLPVDRRPVDKDELDLELALIAAVRYGARSARVLGAFGDRLDQSVAALLIAARWALAEEPLEVTLHAGRHEAHVASPGRDVVRRTPVGATVSLLALTGQADVSCWGLRYPMDRAVLPFGVGLGVSNETAAAQWGVRCHDGCVAVIVLHAAP